MELRPASPEDAKALAKLGRDSFRAAFAHLYKEQDLEHFLNSIYSDEKVAQEIEDESFIHCLAVDSNQLLGFCKLSHPSAFAGHSDAIDPIALNQLYAQPALTGKGIGAALMDWAIGEAHKRDNDAIQLSVWSENFAAHRFYQRYGFAKIADIEFWVGNHRDDEFLFELRLA